MRSGNCVKLTASPSRTAGASKAPSRAIWNHRGTESLAEIEDRVEQIFEDTGWVARTKRTIDAPCCFFRQSARHPHFPVDCGSAVVSPAPRPKAGRWEDRQTITRESAAPLIGSLRQRCGSLRQCRCSGGSGSSGGTARVLPPIANDNSEIMGNEQAGGDLRACIDNAAGRERYLIPDQIARNAKALRSARLVRGPRVCRSGSKCQRRQAPAVSGDDGRSLSRSFTFDIVLVHSQSRFFRDTAAM